MAGTRSSARNNSSPAKGDDAAAGTKRKADNASPKRDRKAAKKQTTIEDSLDVGKVKDTPEDTEVKGAASEKSAVQEDASMEESEETLLEEPKEEPTQEEVAPGANEVDALNDGGAVQESSQREKKLPSNILEKGIVYFFTRNRVGVDEAESVGDLQRTFFVLRPLPLGAKLGDGALPDLENNRLFALPKKVFPKSHNDRFMAFVEKAQTTVQDLKDNFFKGADYETKTAGSRHIEPVTTVAEGVYALTRTEDRSTHLAYTLTIPSSLGEIQEDLGLRSQGSFVISIKNPERPGPASATLPQKPDFPKEIIEEFRGLAWSEVKPKYLDYPNAQILLIGEKLENAVEPTTKDKKHGKETPKEELEELEHEDELRVQHLNGDDSVFDDLKISKDDYPKVPTTW